MISKHKSELQKLVAKLKDKTKDILIDPIKKDPLYQSLNRLFKDENKYHLSRNNKLRFKIRNLARKRYCLEYPPRKSSDTSIGDAINWEWIIYCAQQSKKDIIIVSRDHDYGNPFEDNLILNDWLNHEFKDRVSRKRKIILTNMLSKAFKLLNVNVSKEEEKQEEELISTINSKKIFNNSLDFKKGILNLFIEDEFDKKYWDIIKNIIDDVISKRNKNHE